MKNCRRYRERAMWTCSHQNNIRDLCQLDHDHIKYCPCCFISMDTFKDLCSSCTREHTGNQPTVRSAWAS